MSLEGVGFIRITGYPSDVVVFGATTGIAKQWAFENLNGNPARHAYPIRFADKVLLGTRNKPIVLVAPHMAKEEDRLRLYDLIAATSARIIETAG